MGISPLDDAHNQAVHPMKQIIHVASELMNYTFNNKLIKKYIFFFLTYYLIFILDIRDKQAGKSIINYCKKKIHNLFTDLEINQVLWQITKSQYHNISQYILVITCMFSQKTYNTCMCVYNISGSM
jgi:hypothetical protein